MDEDAGRVAEAADKADEAKEAKEVAADGRRSFESERVGSTLTLTLTWVDPESRSHEGPVLLLVVVEEWRALFKKAFSI